MKRTRFIYRSFAGCLGAGRPASRVDSRLWL